MVNIEMKGKLSYFSPSPEAVRVTWKKERFLKGTRFHRPFEVYGIFAASRKGIETFLIFLFNTSLRYQPQ